MKRKRVSATEKARIAEQSLGLVELEDEDLMSVTGGCCSGCKCCACCGGCCCCCKCGGGGDGEILEGDCGGAV